MSTTSASIQSTARSAGRARNIYAHEWVALAFFLYLTALGLLHKIALGEELLLLAIPGALCGLCFIENDRSTATSRVLREWSSLWLILAGYWSVGFFKAAPIEAYQLKWVAWDRILLNELSMRHALEGLGRLIPSVLEIAYLLLYAIPPLSLGALYLSGMRSSARRYLRVLFLGTFSAYALLPLVPVVSPRIAFPGLDLPDLQGIARPFNTWILDHLDISIGVFPSGHVAVAFSSAFGLLAVLRDRRQIWMAAFGAAFVVYLATVYGRYHYAADGLASIVIAALAWKISDLCEPVLGDSLRFGGLYRQSRLWFVERSACILRKTRSLY